MRFYGLGLHETYELLGEEAEMLWQAITRIEAEDALLAIRVSAYPHQTEDGQSKFHRSLHKMAHPEVYEEKAITLTIDDLAARLHGGR